MLKYPLCGREHRDDLLILRNTILTATTCFGSCLQQLLNRTAIRSFFARLSRFQGDRELYKLCTADTQWPKLYSVRRAFSTRVKKNEDPIISLNIFNSYVAKLAENDVGLDELSYTDLIENLPPEYVGVKERFQGQTKKVTQADLVPSLRNQWNFMPSSNCLTKPIYFALFALSSNRRAYGDKYRWREEGQLVGS